MNKFFYFLILVAFGLLVFGCFSTGNIDWDIKAERQPASFEVVE